MKSNPLKIIMLMMFFPVANASLAQQVNASYLNPMNYSTGIYKFVRLGTSSDYQAGFMYNETSATYGDGDDFSIFTYNNRDMTFRTGTGNLIVFPTSGGNMGIGTKSPEAKMHITDNDGVGIKSQYAKAILESTDAQLDITSSQDGTWGSTINLVEGNGGSNTDIWSIARQTTNGLGDGSLRFNFGTTNSHTNTSKFVVLPDGNVGIGIVVPSERLSIQSPAAGVLSRFATTQHGGLSGLRVQGEANDGDKRFMDIVFDPETYSYGFGAGTNSGQLPINSGLSQADLVVAANGQVEIRKDKLRFSENRGFDYDPAKDAVFFNGFNNGQVAMLSDRDGDAWFSGSVGIGTTTPTEKLEINGTIRSKEVKVEASPWPDYVFEPNYKLRSLEEIEKFIQAEKHLPDVPSSAEVQENGIALGEMNALLLKKIEELTLHLIEMEKTNQVQSSIIEELQKKFEDK